VADLPADERPPAAPQNLGEEVGTREQRKLRARREKDRTLWFGLGMFGLVGWSVGIPTLLGVVLGIWLDRVRPGPFSWTLAMLLAGVALGCLNAWFWISREQQAMNQEREEGDNE
jgi:ATP synthase protein I